jgi:hypothetical protein
MSVRLSDPRPEAAELQTEGPTPARVWGDQWLRVSEKVIKGLNHQLTNRVASLEAVVTLLDDPDEAPDPQLLSSLAQEVKRLHHLLVLYRLVPAEPFVTTAASRSNSIAGATRRPFWCVRQRCCAASWSCSKVRRAMRSAPAGRMPSTWRTAGMQTRSS